MYSGQKSLIKKLWYQQGRAFSIAEGQRVEPLMRKLNSANRQRYQKLEEVLNGAYDDLLCFEHAEMPDLNKSLDNMEENELLFGETGPELNVSITSSEERP